MPELLIQVSYFRRVPGLTRELLNKPEAEAHDLLCDLLQDRITGVFRGRIPELGLKFSEHPSTRRLALAKLDHEECLPRLAEAVASRTSWLSLHF